MGLHKLTTDEISQLNVWLEELADIIAKVSAASPSLVPSGNTVVESKIDGDFECWDGETIFKLLNGQIWQQASYAYKYCYKFMPRVTIYPVSGGYRMQVEGVDEALPVRRLK